MSGHMQSAASSGHLITGANGHIANDCPGFSPVCTDCLETQPDLSLSWNSLACEPSVGTYTFFSYSVIGDVCAWEWRKTDGFKPGQLRIFLDSNTDEWASALLILGFGGARYGLGDPGQPGAAKDITGDVECDEDGIIDHIIAAPFTLESDPNLCGNNGVVSITLNP